ncbi:MAG: Ig-like domain-containing protein, partial [Deltaproteobacteria bacterium]|nr:Ig-like domain-containing protein [Deltaproteobacteria bacterium]
FSESMDLSTLNIDTFLLNDGTNYIAGTVNCEGSTATFMPTTALSYNTTYTVTITTGAKDSTGNPLQGDYLWSFKTRAETDSGSGIWLQISGEIAYEETPLCSMVLANGQHMFTCGNDLGIYDLEVPLDQNGEITLYGFCAGFSPFKTKLAPAEALDYDIHMTRSPAGSREMEITAQTEPGTTNPDRVRISGTVTYNETLLCAMVLANGQSMFSCGNNLGNFDLEVPLDLNGEITLYCFCSGFAPYKDVFVP